MKTPTLKTWLIAATLMVTGAHAQAADWGLFRIAPNAPRPAAVAVAPAAADDTDGADANCNCNGGTIRGRAPQRHAEKILAAAKKAEPRKPTIKQRVAEADRIAAAGGTDRAARLAQAAFYQAARPRRIADFKWAGLSRAKKKSLGRVWSGIGVSKGMCAQASREALNEIGIVLPRGHAFTKRPVLLKAGFKPVKFDPWSAKPGTVFVCNGGGSGNGHMEIAVQRDGQRLFCSDFCSPNPTCSKKSYSRPTAFELPGA